MSEPDASSKRSSLRSHQGAASAAGSLGVLEERGDSAPAPHQVMMMVVMVMMVMCTYTIVFSFEIFEHILALIKIQQML